MRNKNQKIKLLRTWEILRQDTDEEHTMSTVALMERLAEEDIASERKSVYDDIRILQENGYPVRTKRTRVNEYYVDDNSFSMAEMRLLMDTVQAARFLSSAKAKELSLKIAALGGSTKGERLRLNTQFADAGKRKEDYVIANIETLQQALERKRKVRFRYFDLDVGKNRAYRTRTNGSEWYEVSPRCLMCADDNYYMVCVTAGHEDYSSYRVDRMDDITLLAAKVDAPAWCKDRPVTQYLKGSFNMYAGETKRVTLLCKNDPKAINTVLDRFGYDLKLVDHGDGYFHCSADVQLSPVFYAWLSTVGDLGVRLYAPSDVRDRYLAMLGRQMENYGEPVDK